MGNGREQRTEQLGSTYEDGTICNGVLKLVAAVVKGTEGDALTVQGNTDVLELSFLWDRNVSEKETEYKVQGAECQECSFEVQGYVTDTVVGHCNGGQKSSCCEGDAYEDDGATNEMHFFSEGNQA